MAKITANGAHEVAREKAHSRGGTEYLFVMCSDGRILKRVTGEYGGGYTVRARGVHSDDRTRAYLRKFIAEKDNLVVAS